jgi:hypothetical protein
MADIPGGQGLLPSVVTNITTISSGVSVPIGLRVASIIGTGLRQEIIVASANGDGNDGFNPTYTSTVGSDGRHFLLNFSPVVSNRTQLFRNGIPLVGQEAQISATFPQIYDYQLDITTGEIQLQAAYLVNQGGTESAQVYYIPAATNVGQGSLQNLSLVDTDAPTETWTIKCISVQRNNLNQPVAQTAVFTAFGSVSGNVLNANGQTVTWVSNNTVATNDILTFSIQETTPPFQPGDYFTVQVQSGTLIQNDSLTANYIAVADINSPIFLSSIPPIATQFGPVTLSNTLSLGCQLAFANGTPGIMCVEAAPPLPRRTSLELEDNFDATSTVCNDFIIPFPPGVQPALNTPIHIFVTNPTTLVEQQLIPNLFPFYTLGTSGQPTICNFVMDNVNPPGGNSFSYSVIQQNEAINFAQDGYLSASLTSPTNAFFSSASVQFNGTYINKLLVINDATNPANIGSFTITAANDGIITVTATGSPPFANFIADTSMTWNLINENTGLVVATGTDGAVAGASASQCTFTSSSTNFTTLVGSDPEGFQLQIVSSVHSVNIGLFDILSNPTTHTLVIAMSFISEADLTWEIQDPTATGEYLVLNHNIVPNGYDLRITYVDSRDATFFDAGWELALASLETQEIDILVPLPQQTISIIFQNALNHCITMSNIRNRKERVLFIGAINGLTPSNLTGASLAAVESLGILEGIQGNTTAEILAGDTEDLLNYSVAAAYGDTYRCVYFFPDQILVQVGADNQIIDGFYIAAAAAGYVSATPLVAMPLTNKVIAGFTILTNRQFNQLTYEGLAAAGVTSLASVSGGGNVLWGLTTTQSGFVEEQEISIVFIRDAIAKALRAGFAGFIGLPQNVDEVATLTTRAISMLNGFISQQLITAYQNLSVQQDATLPTQWNISVSVQPVYPVNFIYISVGIGQL